MASATFSNAFAIVLPWDMQPGSCGTSATYPRYSES
jgi:hypothetical protein